MHCIYLACHNMLSATTCLFTARGLERSTSEKKLFLCVFDRRPEKEEKTSEEAAKVISLLPDLSFMQARVLMFPSILTPAANQI